MAHIYEEDGILIPSVTTILHILGNDALIKWANSMGFKRIDCEKYTARRAVVGTYAHELVRSIVEEGYQSDLPPVDNLVVHEVEKMGENFKKWYKDKDIQTIYCEKTILNKEKRYGGTLDWYCMYEGKKTLFDFKTSKNLKDTMPLQLGGYSKLLSDIEGIEVEQAGIIFLAEENPKPPVMFTKEELDQNADMFEALAVFYHKWIKNLNK